MIEILLQSIPKIVYEPLAVGALCGILLLCWKTRPFRNRWGWIIGAVLLWMIAWRTIYQIISSRYASVLIYFAVILTVYACFRLETFCRDICRCPKRFAAYIPYVFIGGLMIACLLKAIHFDPYSSHISQGYEVLRTFAARETVTVWTEEDNAMRTQFYTGIQTVPLERIDSAALREELKNFRRFGTALLLDIQERSSQPFQNRQELGLSESAEWQPVFSCYANRKKKKKHNIYRYKPLLPVQVSCPAEPMEMTGNMLKDGGLELLDSPEISAKRLPVHMREIPFYDNREFRMPRTGYFGIPSKKYGPGKAPELEIVTEDVIAGKYSLKIHARGEDGYWVFYERFPSGCYLYSVRVKGLPGTLVQLFLNTAKHNAYFGNFPVAEFRLPDEKLYELKVMISEDDVRGGDYFHPAVKVNQGEAMLDDFFLKETGSFREPH